MEKARETSRRRRCCFPSREQGQIESCLSDRQSLSNVYCVDLFVSNNRVQYLVSIPVNTMVIRFICKEKTQKRTDIRKPPILLASTLEQSIIRCLAPNVKSYV